MAPASTMMTAMAEAKIGRWMKKPDHARQAPTGWPPARSGQADNPPVTCEATLRRELAGACRAAAASRSTRHRPGRPSSLPAIIGSLEHAVYG